MIQFASFILVLFVSYGIFIKGLFSLLGSLPILGVPIAAFITNWFISLSFLCICKFVPFSLSPRYYEFLQFEKDRRIYERLGIKIVQPIIKFLGLIEFSGDRSDLSLLVKNMRQAELNHALTLVAVTVLAVESAIGWVWDYAFWLMVFNMIFNVYPIMLQRYNRVRLEPIANRARIKQRLIK